MGDVFIADRNIVNDKEVNDAAAEMADRKRRTKKPDQASNIKDESDVFIADRNIVNDEEVNDAAAEMADKRKKKRKPRRDGKDESDVFFADRAVRNRRGRWGRDEVLEKNDAAAAMA